MDYAISGFVCFLGGIVVCAIFKSKVIAEIKSSLIRIEALLARATGQPAAATAPQAQAQKAK